MARVHVSTLRGLCVNPNVFLTLSFTYSSLPAPRSFTPQGVRGASAATPGSATAGQLPSTYIAHLNDDFLITTRCAHHHETCRGCPDLTNERTRPSAFMAMLLMHACCSPLNGRVCGSHDRTFRYPFTSRTALFVCVMNARVRCLLASLHRGLKSSLPILPTD